jgi:hypothetical protein
VPAARPSLFALFAAVAGLACAGVDHRTQHERKDAGGILFDARKADDELPCSATGVMPLAPRPADVLVLLDRSSTMDTAFGAGSRQQALAEQLSDLVVSYQRHVRFGFMEMPGKTGCEGQAGGCCVFRPLVDPALGNAAAMSVAIAEAAPVGGNTPTAAALLAAKIYFDRLDDGIDNRFILLATDGVPTCTLSGALSDGTLRTSPACSDALAEVESLVSSGVKVVVLSVGSELAGNTASGCLDALAHAGGAAFSPGSPGYYAAADPAQLRTEMERIFGAVGRPSCALPLPPGAKKGLIAVYLDGQQIPEVETTLADGWCRSCSGIFTTDILVTGAYCERIQRFEVDGFEAQYETGCEVPPPP